jgi:hypothetical protein
MSNNNNNNKPPGPMNGGWVCVCKGGEGDRGTHHRASRGPGDDPWQQSRLEQRLHHAQVVHRQRGPCGNGVHTSVLGASPARLAHDWEGSDEPSYNIASHLLTA